MPFQLVGSAIVTSPNGKGVILIGGYNQNDKIYSEYLIELTGNSLKTLRWTILEQKLQYCRERHVAFLISDSMTAFLKK